MTLPLYIDCSAFVRARLAELLPDPAGRLDIHEGDPSAAEILRLAAGREVLLNGHSFLPRAVLEGLPALRRIVFLGTGASSYIDLAAAADLGIRVDTVPGYGDRAVAEHAFALLLAAARGVATMDGALRSGSWRPLDGIELGGRRLGILGFGGIGRALAGMAQGFGMEVAIWNRSPLTDPPAPQLPLEEVLESSDAISLHLALNAATRGFLNAGRIARMRSGAILVNTARAGLIEEAALIAALRSGHLRHAALDVFEAEPLAPDSPWPAMPATTLTAHAGFKTPEATLRLMRLALDMVGIPTV